MNAHPGQAQFAAHDDGLAPGALLLEVKNVSLSFGGVKPGDFEANLRYNRNRIFAFVLALGEVDAEKYAAAAGALNYGFPVIADTNIPEILPSGITTYEHVVANVPHDSMVERALEVRGCKIKVTKVPIPVAYGAAFAQAPEDPADEQRHDHLVQAPAQHVPHNAIFPCSARCSARRVVRVVRASMTLRPRGASVVSMRASRSSRRDVTSRWATP